MITTALALAIVVQDPVALRAAPSSHAPQQAVLTQGDLLEVRGERLDYVQVYDHRRERAGYVRATQVRPLELAEAQAPQLLAVMRFLRDTPGAESLGIAYVAAYLKAAPAAQIGAEPFDTLGVLAERLARRASMRGAGETVAAHVESVGQYGVKFSSYEREGSIQLCYDGEAFLRVLMMASASAEQKARAALALTRNDCVDPALRPNELAAQDRMRAILLDRVDGAPFAQLPETLKNRLHLRRAGVWSAVAFERSRAGEAPASAAQRAIDELAAVNKGELADDDQGEYAEAAVRVGASRWAALPGVPPQSRLSVNTQPGEPGQTCVLLGDAQHKEALARRCTWGAVWIASARVSPDGKTLALAVQPLAGWTELWLFRQQAQGWDVTVLPPAASEPGLGYVEFAGWVPRSTKMLLAREARVEGRVRRSFEVFNLETLATEKQASMPQLLVLFGQWQDALWKSQTVSLR